MEVVFLKDRVEFLPALARQHGREWAHLYPGWNEAAARREFELCVGTQSLPVSLLAIEQGELLGSVSINRDDLPGAEPLNPWLAGFLINPGHRGRGVGSLLAQHAEAVMREQGIRQAYLFTETAGPFFRKMGWEFVKKSNCNGLPVEIYVRYLS